MQENSLKNFKGVIPALLTAFDEKGYYCPKYQKEIIDFLVSMKADGFYITGSTGHGAVMDVSEHAEAIDSICSLTDGRLPVAAHIAKVSSKDSSKLAESAEKSGCIAVSAVPSYYYKLNMEQMVRYYSEISDSVNIPLIVYAQTDNYTPSVEMFETLARIKNVRGLKFTGSDHYMMGRIKEHLGSDFMVYSGRDEMCLSGIISGADGIIGSTYNVLPDLNARAVENLKKGNFTQAKNDLMTANAVIEKMFPLGVMSSLRACLEFMGVNPGHQPSPFSDLDKAQKDELKSALRSVKKKSRSELFALFDAI